MYCKKRDLLHILKKIFSNHRNTSICICTYSKATTTINIKKKLNIEVFSFFRILIIYFIVFILAIYRNIYV